MKHWVPGHAFSVGRSLPRPSLDNPNGFSGSAQTPTWAGYLLDAANQTSYTNVNFWQVASEWVVPYPRIYDNLDSTIWAGLGGNNTGGSLLQAGTDEADNLNVGPFFWYEDFPQGQMGVTAPPVARGDLVEVDFGYVGNNQTNYTFVDITTGAYHNYGDVPTPYTTLIGTSAEAIYEDSAVVAGHQYSPINTLYFTYPYAYAYVGAGNTNVFNQFLNWNYTQFIMVDGSTPWAVPTPIYSDDHFNICFLASPC